TGPLHDVSRGNYSSFHHAGHAVGHGFAFGAIVSPPDAVAATAIAEQIRLPSRIVTILEGESLVNDATGLVTLRFALAAGASGSFSTTQAAMEFVWVVAGGVGLGLAVSLVFTRVFHLIKNVSLLVTVSLLVPYIAYLPAERLHVSGVLAAVAAGIYGGWKEPELLSASTRLNAVAVWGMVRFLLHVILFLLVGLQLPGGVGGLGPYWPGQVIACGC